MGNLVGTAACCYYLGSCWWYARRTTVGWGRGAASGTLSAVLLSLLSFGYASSSTDAALHVGYVAMVFNVIMYGAPLASVRQVIREKSAEVLPPLQCALGFACSALWLTVGIHNDILPTIIPNAMGLVLAALQLALIVWFPAGRSAAKKQAPTDQ